jgi:hypothetical protein
MSMMFTKGVNVDFYPYFRIIPHNNGLLLMFYARFFEKMMFFLNQRSSSKNVNYVGLLIPPYPKVAFTHPFVFYQIHTSQIYKLLHKRHAF